MNNKFQELIENYEDRGRFVAKNLICAPEFFSTGYNTSVTYTNINCHVDLIGSTFNYNNSAEFKFVAEVKENYGGVGLPNHLLRVDKKENVLKTAGAAGSRSFYIILEDRSKAYLYLLDRLDWNQTYTRNLWLRKVEPDPNSEKVLREVIFIPKTLAFKTFDITGYYADYYKTRKEDI